MKFAQTLTAALTAAILAVPLAAQNEAAVDSVAPRSGFWLRFGAGGGSTIMAADDPAMEISGSATIPHLALGKFINDDMVVYGSIDGGMIAGYDVKLDGDRIGSADSDRTASLHILGLGAGYYLLPNSLFLGASIGSAWLSLAEDEEQIAESNMGFGGALVLAKDFRISRRFQLGAALHLSVGTMTDKDGGPRWTAHSEGLALSLTYAAESWGPR